MAEFGTAWIWVLIPIVAILSGTFKEWIKIRATQRELGSSTDELERQVADLGKDRAELIERIQNLEAIVVSQTWGVLHEKGLAPAVQEAKLASVARRELGAAPDSTPTNQQRAEQLANRLR